jgi:hypothetical protein
MMRQKPRWAAAGAALAALLIVSAAGCTADKGKEAPPTGYGAFLPSAAFAEEGDAAVVADGSGMSGSEAKSHTHSASAADMWRVTRERGGPGIALTFDLGAVHPLGEMWIWNYNAADPATGESASQYGLREVRIYYSADGNDWTELKGEGHPYRFARAPGAHGAKATNLDAEGHPPVRFGGVPARYVKIEAAAEPGKGNWDEGAGGTSDYGLSEVRFYRDAPAAASGETIVPVSVWSNVPSAEGRGPEFAANHSGMSGARSVADTHGSDPGTMWLAAARPGEAVEWVADLGGTYPLGEMHVWNYNGADAAEGAASLDAGLRRVRVFHSLDGKEWTELKGEGYPYELARADGGEKLKPTGLNDGKGSPIRFDNAFARFVKIVPEAEAGAGNWGAERDGLVLYGLSEVRITLGEGLLAEPAPEWTALFSSYEGWTGADGIYSVALNGYDAPGKAAETKTLFWFSDTFIGKVHPVTRHRLSSNMLNNTMALLEGGQPDPSRIKFIWTANIPDVNLFTPKTANAPQGSWYWPQDGVRIGDSVYLFPLLMVRDPSGPPGFQFQIAGVSMVRLPVGDDGPEFENQVQFETPLYAKLPDGSGEIVFGAGVMDNTEASGAPNPDGYVYVYGYRNLFSGTKSLLAARVRPDQIEDFSQWTYWDGGGWSQDPMDASPLLDGVSAELSVTPMADEPFKGKYVVVSEKDTLSGYVAISAGDSPVGPFPEFAPVYFVPEASDEAKRAGIITYNAKAHPHLSQPGELLISYNVNSTAATGNTYDGDIYRPRWIRLKLIGQP